jgi:hypothetical protein
MARHDHHSKETNQRMRYLTTLASTLALFLALSGCADDPTDASPPDQAAPSPSETASSSEKKSAKPKPEEPEGPVLEVAIDGAGVSPNSQRIELARGEPLVIEFRSDRAGELHVHAKPEQFVQFPAGSSTRELVIDVPGLVEVEEHETGAVVAQLEVQ